VVGHATPVIVQQCLVLVNLPARASNRAEEPFCAVHKPKRRNYGSTGWTGVALPPGLLLQQQAAECL
jgi:hypothetical protein